MDEATFWMHLEFRLSGEFKGLPERHQRQWWCDGFEPAHYHLDETEPRITGRAWMCPGRGEQQEWKFTLFLPGTVTSRDSIEWATLLPANDVTRWMSFDPERRMLQIDPSAAVPDLKPTND